MSIFRRMSFCTRGYHRVSVSHLAFSGFQSLTLQSTTELGNYVPVTYFRCRDCGGLFEAVGEERVTIEEGKSFPVVMAEIPEHHLAELKKTPWWPTDFRAVWDGGIECEVTYRDPLPEPQRCPPAPPVPEPMAPPIDMAAMLKAHNTPLLSTSTPQALKRLMAALEHLNIVVMGGPRRSLKDQVYCHMAETIAQLGTCRRLKVGCVLLTNEGKVCGIGYNGSGPGMPHCECETCNEKCRCRRTRHAEKNALSNCSGRPYAAFLTHEPCVDCAKDLIAEGVRRVVYIAPYTSIAAEERAARQEWIDHYQVSWEQLKAELG